MQPFNTDIAWTKAMDDGDACGDCPHAHYWTEHHPYGMGTAAEQLFECSADTATTCPAVQRAALSYVADHGGIGLVTELCRRSSSDDLLAAFIAQHADLTLQEACWVLDAFKIWADAQHIGPSKATPQEV